MICTLLQKKGGSGKSTLAISLAAYYSSVYETGYLDTDEQQSGIMWSERRKRHASNTVIEFRFNLGNVADTIKAMYTRNEILIIDTAGFNSNEARIAIAHSNIVVCPFRPRQLDLDVTSQLIQIIQEMTPANPRMKVYAQLNQASTRPNDQRESQAREFLEGHDMKVLESVTRYREVFGDSIAEGKGVTELENGKAAREVANLGDEILNIHNGAHDDN